jgi:mannose-6-phosphate isomerase-like protein (cupin superfamily)
MRRELNTIYDENIDAWFGESMPISNQDMNQRVWRFNDLTPSPRAFLDCQLPGHTRTLYSALGHGADDEQLEGTAVEQAENYHIDYVKADPGNGAALHSHGSEETFIALESEWRVFWGDDGEESLVLNRFDGIVVPAGVLRGFSNCGSVPGVLLVVLGAHNTGHCVWGKNMHEPFSKAGS